VLRRRGKSRVVYMFTLLEMRAEGIRCSIEDVFENPTLSYALQISKLGKKL
jgi:hypothetical protein